MSVALDRFEVLIGDVDNLLEHHSKFLEPSPGRPSGDEGPLLRSCVLLLAAAWEVYFEDSLIETASTLSQRDRSDIPDATLDYVAANVTDPWQLAGDGWRAALVDIVTVKMRGRDNDPSSFGVNGAGPGAIAILQREILGTQIIDRCRWSARGRNSSKAVKDHLQKLVALRGEIAHNGRPLVGRLNLAQVRNWHNFVKRLAEKHDQQLSRWLAETADIIVNV